MEIKFKLGDITKLKNVDAIVNAANTSLLGGEGVDGCIHRAAGPKLLEECRTLGGCATGEAKITKGYNLGCKIIHTVGPIYNENREHECMSELYRAYTNSRKRAVENNCRVIAFPAISTGIYGYPLEKATRIAMSAILNFEDADKIDRIIFCLFDEKTYGYYLSCYMNY